MALLCLSCGCAQLRVTVDIFDGELPAQQPTAAAIDKELLGLERLLRSQAAADRQSFDALSDAAKSLFDAVNDLVVDLNTGQPDFSANALHNQTASLISSNQREVQNLETARANTTAKILDLVGRARAADTLAAKQAILIEINALVVQRETALAEYIAGYSAGLAKLESIYTVAVNGSEESVLRLVQSLNDAERIAAMLGKDNDETTTALANALEASNSITTSQSRLLARSVEAAEATAAARVPLGDPNMPTIVNACPSEWARGANYVDTFGGFGNSEFVLTREDMGTFQLKSHAFDPSHFLRIAPSVAKAGLHVAAKVYGFGGASTSQPEDGNAGDAATSLQAQELFLQRQHERRLAAVHATLRDLLQVAATGTADTAATTTPDQRGQWAGNIRQHLDQDDED